MTAKNAKYTVFTKSRSFEKSLLRDEDVKFGFDNRELLVQLGLVVQQLAHQNASGESSHVETAGIDQGPSLLTLVRLAHAAGKRLVIGLQDAENDGSEVQHVVTL